MGLFDKEKLAKIADKAKESLDEAKAEKERRKELGLLNDTSVKVEYKGGHPALPKEGDCTLKMTNDSVTLSISLARYATIDYATINNISFETAEQIGKRITATRLLTLGVFALAFKKKTKDSEKYLTIEFSENGIDSAVLFGGKKAQEAYSKLYERFAGYKNRVEKESPNVTNKTSSYDEIIKLKELLDMGIISKAEFEAKKKELLGL